MNWSKSRVAGAMLLAVFSLFVTGCGGGGGDNTAALLTNVTAQQSQLDANNKSVIESSLDGRIGGSTWGIVAGTSAVRNSFYSYSSSKGKQPVQQTDYRYSVDTAGRLTKQKAVFGTMSSSTAYTYDGSTTVVKRMCNNDTSNHITQVDYNYDMSGRISEYRTITATVSTTSIDYYGDGRRQTTTMGDGTTLVFSKPIVVDYDSHNNQISYSNGNSSYRYDRTYDAYGNETETKYYTKDPYTATEVLKYDVVLTYGPSTITLKVTIYNRDGALTGTQEGIATYSSNGKLATESYVLKDAKGIVTSTLYIAHTYDASGNKLSFNEVMKDAVGTIQSISSMQYTYVTLVSGKDDQ